MSHSATVTAPASSSGSARCTDNSASRLVGPAEQLVTVQKVGLSQSTAQLELWDRSGPCWVPAGGPWPAVIGRNGFSSHHHEGDGTTPTGTYLLGRTVYGNEPNPGYRGPYHRLVCGDWWDEDPTSPAYNTFQHVTCGRAPPFGGDSEPLWAETSYYPFLVVVDYNVDPVVPYAGSAIFVHASTGVPTTGCVSIPEPDLRVLLRWLAPDPPAAITLGLGGPRRTAGHGNHEPAAQSVALSLRAGSGGSQVGVLH